MTGAALDARVVVQRSAEFTLSVGVRAAAGETVAVMGPSGAGKSTLLAALAGFAGIDDGHIRLGDRDLVSGPGGRARAVDPAHRGIVLLGQDPRLFPHLSVSDNVAFGLRAHGTHRHAARAQAAEWLARVGLPDAGGRRPSELSGGEQQRVALARALAARPSLVLLDEPLVSLDPDTADGLRTVIRAALDCTAIVVTHAAVDALALARRLVVIEDGRVSQEGPVRDVFAAPGTPFVASLAGLDRVEGTLRGGRWEADGVRIPGAVAPGLRDGDAVVAVFPPGAVQLSAADADAAGVGGVDAGGDEARSAGAGAWSAGAGDVARSAGAGAWSAGAGDVARSAGAGAWSAGAGDVVRSAGVGDVGAGAGDVGAGAGEHAAGTWIARVRRLEPTLAGVRVHTAAPAVAVDVPLEAVAALGLEAGVAVRLRVAASAVRILPIAPAPHP
ncbi:ATP-binding cassette domain-containing protein [Microbacterium sp. X-17]|uniref:ABC transporter ATP-binding protein n=1 Tax=Microbacterium sp. X-17 TaxID=3144404 RepID=UPI0031F4A2AB